MDFIFKVKDDFSKESIFSDVILSVTNSRKKKQREIILIFFRK